MLESVLPGNINWAVSRRLHSPYQGVNSLQPYSERDVSLTTTLFLGLRLTATRSFISTLKSREDADSAGLRASRIFRMANCLGWFRPRRNHTSLTSMFRTILDLGARRDRFKAEENQLAGERLMTRYTVVAGRFTVTDFSTTTATWNRN